MTIAAPDQVTGIRAEGAWNATATWAEVREKARRIRADGHVRLLVAKDGYVVGEVKGDHAYYQTRLTRVPGRQALAMWECGCKWAAYSWGRTGPWTRFEGRQCSHSLATLYEAQARGMFGREIRPDVERPHWLPEGEPVYEQGQYDRSMKAYTMLREMLMGATAAAGRPFEGDVDGAAIPLTLMPDGRVMTHDGKEISPDLVRHPQYSPTLGLTAGKAPKESDPPTHAGLALRAADTGRVLMIQRSNKDQKDPARGTWEFPGGGVEEGDHNSLHAAMREFAEEIGQPVPAGGEVRHVWRSGGYRGHVVEIPSEDAIKLHEGRVVVNPDDPDGDDSEQAAWWDADHARKNPALRAECKGSPWDKIKTASRGRRASMDDTGVPDDHFSGFDVAPAETVDDDQEHALPVAYGDDGDDVHTALLRAAGARSLSSTAHRQFSLREQDEIINEGGGMTRARNLDALDVTGTHYEHMGPADGLDDDLFPWGM